jgi:hypothetical protein
MGSCFKMGHVSKLVHDCSWLGHVSNWDVSKLVRLFVVGFMCQNWFTIVRGWFMCKTGSRLFVVGSCVVVHDCSWFKSIRLAILTPKH